MKFAQGSEGILVIGVKEQNDPVFFLGLSFPTAGEIRVAQRDVRMSIESR